MRQNNLLTIFAAVLIIGIFSMIGAYAYKGDPSVQGPNYDADVHEQMEAAIEAGDYDAWINIRQENNLPMNGRMFQAINKDNFASYAKMHEAMESGDYETANIIRQELGLGQGMQSGQGCQRMNSGTGCQGSCGNYAIN